MDVVAQELLSGMEDHGFCECLMACLHNEEGGGLSLLYEDWVLARLRLIKERASHVYFGAFLTPLRQQFRGRVYPPDIADAMRGAIGEANAIHGDVGSVTWAQDVEAVYTHGLPPGYSPGWANVAQHYTVRPGEVTVVTGVANSMKSMWIHGLCVNLARLHNWHISLFSPEHYPVGLLGGHLLQQYAGMSMGEMSAEQFADALSWVSQRFHPIVAPEEVQPTLSWLLAVARIQKERYGMHGFVLDPWNEIEHSWGRGETETQYISASLSRIRRFARAQQVHVWIVAHPAKMAKAEKGRYAGKYPPPTPYDVAGSAHFYNKADNCVSIWRDIEEDSACVEVHIQKVRNRSVGRIGSVELAYDGYRFQEVSPEEEARWNY